MAHYGLWPIVIINSLIIIVFAFSFSRPRSFKDWRTFGTFSAFIVALFTEMYGFPLTIYLLSGWLGSHYPELDIFSHDNGHLWYTLLGFTGDPHSNPIHGVSDLLISGGLIFLGFTWMFLYRAQRKGVVATSGPYAYVRHPQYIAFIAVMTGFLIQWPTLLTVLMYPVLIRMYVWLARQEEKDALEQFGEEYASYAAVTPGFIPFSRSGMSKAS
ncbi:methyltransferase family protein [Sporomusa malonica]|uniref:Protein-S-isoprenylcysteine O-methyltransferase Ste14 n=1 Tax=Sporomusa malonica TaxID=112901 RepID=A0A1W1Z7I0_9FIRM|nr:isoprenylcysteine carboxylmethyltransferase family protein [Sporomusa malonica]SMC44344.1 Protein-S-isoprenylcysteine O-methyltransferase Ste14 [Sporomusa malonica]